MSYGSGCDNCEFAGQSISALAGETRLALTDGGNILYVEPSACGIQMGKVGSDELESDYPEFLQRLEDCEGPTTETIETPRVWPLGSLGFVKQVEVRRCGATDSAELLQIVAESRSKVRIQE